MGIHDDDMPVGRILSRREVLALIGGTGAAMVAGLSLPRFVQAQTGGTPTATPLPACVVRPELTEGPYFVANDLNRFDIRFDPTNDIMREGTPLLLVYRVSDMTGGTCAPLAGAQVDVWHCDAEGQYSGVQDPGFDNSGELWLRGFQLTDDDGIAKFLTIVPGWYSGRAVHIHFKIRTETAEAESYEFTSQFFFDPEQIEEVYTAAPYAERGLPDVPNERESIYRQSNGLLNLDLLPLTDEEMEESEVEAGYSATFDIGLDLSDAAVGASDGFGGGRRG